ncbi:MAG: DUF992 domain-containing protein [Methyloligellaceae bacterium]
MKRRPYGFWSAAAVTAAVFAFALIAVPSVLQAQRPASPPEGVLRCDVSGGVSFIIGSTRRLECVYSPTQGPAEFYKGRINKFGVDVGFLKAGVIVWSVLSPGVNKRRGALAGTYVGVSAQVAAVRGVGANALVAANKIMLNPLSVEGLRGVNVAAGISGLRLDYVDLQPGTQNQPLPIEPRTR